MDGATVIANLSMRACLPFVSVANGMRPISCICFETYSDKKY
jgi:hypothetical protein